MLFLLSDHALDLKLMPKQLCYNVWQIDQKSQLNKYYYYSTTTTPENEDATRVPQLNKWICTISIIDNLQGLWRVIQAAWNAQSANASKIMLRNGRF